MKYYWEAKADYRDGTTVEILFDYNEQVEDDVQQYEIESWLIERHPGCFWYSVNFVCDEE